MGAVLDREPHAATVGHHLPDEVTATARLGGLRDCATPTLEAVERRRWQLWLLSGAFLVAMTALGLTAWRWPALVGRLGVPEGTLWPARLCLLMGGLTLALGAYTVEKESHLRRLTRLLIDERVLTSTLSHHLGEVNALLAAGTAMNSVLELDAVLDIILDNATSLLGAESGWIMLLGEDDLLRAVCVRGDQLAVGATVSLGTGIAGEVARRREPLLVTTPPQAAPDEAVETSMCVPLVHRGRVLGVLHVDGRDHRRFSDYDLRALCLFAEHAASAIANGHLYEAERVRVAELVDSELHKSEFLADVSHDLRTPLTSLIGCAKMLQQADIPDDHRRELTAMVDRQAVRLNQMIEDLLTAARLELDSPAASGPVDVAALAQALAGEFAVAGRELNVVSPASVIACGHEESLRRAFTNLVENAFKHGKAPVALAVTAAPGGLVEVAVTDCGAGVPAEDRERIFTRFARLDQSRPTPGIGLGLSIVQGLVHSCGGEVWAAEPASGRGAEMRVTLRAA